MKADLTRYTFDPFKHFTRVVMQQGRVQLDADWNEQAAILLKYLQTLAADLIGPHGGPTANLGFQIAGSSSAADFAISPGHYYVDGILCELVSPSPPVPILKPSGNTFNIPASAAASFSNGQSVLLSGGGQSALTIVQSVTTQGSVTVAGGTDVTAVLASSNPQAYSKYISYLTQPDYPGPTPLQSSLIYLDVWERLVTYVEDDSIREVALDGADTAARSKLICQVKQWTGSTSCTVDLKSQFQPANRGRLMAQAKQTSTSTDPCVIAPNASYRGPENQLYRVEIHTGTGKDANNNPLTPTFKWSRENGSVVFPIVSLAPGSGTTTVVLENLGRDDRFGLSENDWVEIQDDDYVLQNRAETLLQVHCIASGSLTVTLNGSPISKVGQDQTKHPLLRRWDQTAGQSSQGGLQLGTDNAAQILEGSTDTNWLTLEDGIQIQFQPASPSAPANQYRTGDYWLIPARTATGNIAWPTGNTGSPLAVPPDGVDHHYAPLAIVSVAGTVVDVTATCQKEFGQMQPA